jgi:hypothetical protein
MPDSENITKNMPQRLCSEIQLFDLCDLDSCTYKSGRFCTDQEMLGNFERIAEEERAIPEQYLSEEADDGDDGNEFDDEYSLDECDGDEDYDREYED